MSPSLHSRFRFPMITGVSLLAPLVFLIGPLVILIGGCGSGQKKDTDGAQKTAGYQVEESYFGETPEGDSAMLYTLKNGEELVVKITNYGGIVTEIQTPDREGDMENIVLGFENLNQYLQGHPYFGAIVGRYANRIADARFTLDGENYLLEANNGDNTLHGGIEGFDKKLWKTEILPAEERAAIRLTYLSPHMEEGFPGNLKVTVTCELLSDRLVLTYEAETDQATPLNLTNHTYFNPAGEGTILDHILYINASRYTPVDEELIPTGELANVEGTPFDFRKPMVIGARIDEVPGGYDHNYVLDKGEGEMVLAAKVMDPKSGRFVEVSTTEPAVQLYTGNFLDGTLRSGDRIYVKNSGMCLETQHFPDSPNQPGFPDSILRPGESFSSQTVFRFGVEE